MYEVFTVINAFLSTARTMLHNCSGDLPQHLRPQFEIVYQDLRTAARSLSTLCDLMHNDKYVKKENT